MRPKLFSACKIPLTSNDIIPTPSYLELGKVTRPNCGFREAIKVKHFAQGHKCHDWDSNPHLNDLPTRTWIWCPKNLDHAPYPFYCRLWFDRFSNCFNFLSSVESAFPGGCTPLHLLNLPIKVGRPPAVPRGPDMKAFRELESNYWQVSLTTFSVYPHQE